MSTAPAIGIDLGTTYSCAAVCRKGEVIIIPNAEGDRLTPSVVSFGATRLVGKAAKEHETIEPQNTIYEVKRLIGRNFNDANVQRDIGLWPFRVINEQGRPKIAVNHQGMEKTFYPEEISSMVLARLKDEATKFLGSPVREAVITVPAYFSDSQRQATKDAGTIAGLNVLRIINEPTAGALAYGLGDTDSDERNVLIFDFGGGTFDVSVLTIEEGIFEVRSTAGDTHLGGCDLDSRLVEHFADEFERRHGRSVRGSPKVMQRLRTACERVKRMLSSASETSLQLDALHAGIDFQVTVTRARFENLCADLFQATLEPVRKAMSDAKLNKSDISDVVLVGGSTRIPAVQKMLRDFFDGKELDHTVNPDEAVAAGAAIQAAALSGDLSQTVMDLVLVDVTPLSLGTNVHGGMNSIIVPRNTTIPTRKTGEYSTVRDFQTSIVVKIQEGERTMSKDTNVLGEFNLTGITRAPAGVPKLEITYEIDADGILHATAVDKTSGKSNSITITNDKGRLSQREIERLVKEAENWKQDDEKKKEAALAKNDLERFCYETKKKVQGLGRDTENTEKIFQRIEETLSWIQQCDSLKNQGRVEYDDELDVELPRRSTSFRR